MFPRLVRNTLGRSCSSRLAVFPASTASLKIACASSFSFTTALITRSLMRICMAYTAARVEPGKM